MAVITAQLEKDLNAAVEAGLVSAKRHPTAPFTIYNYTKRCAWERAWTTATLAARGLILDDFGKIVARPFTKFFNLSELSDEQVLALGDVVSVMEKMDGSLGIAYSTSEGTAIATRGSFTSDQAVHATRLVREKYPYWGPGHGVTALFEIVYPENRIVTDYGDLDDLVLLAVIDNETGRDLDLSTVGWSGPIAMSFSDSWVTQPKPLSEVLEWLEEFTGPNTMDNEGYVLRFTSGERVKIKHDEYVRLHRLMTGVTARRVWEELAAGRSLDPLVANVPEEFENWIRATQIDLTTQWVRETEQARAYREMVVKTLEQKLPYTRKEFATLVKAWVPAAYQGAVFSLEDDRSISSWAWKQVRPEHDTPFKAEDEAAN